MNNAWDIVEQFENTVAKFYGAPYAVAVDCCTHAIELSLRLTKATQVTCPQQTYISVPFTFEKLNLSWMFTQAEWKDYYYIGGTNIVDAAVYWKSNGYISGTYMCLSFQKQKHLSLGRGGMILLDNVEDRDKLVQMAYDGRSRVMPWATQNIATIGYHYYMTPEIAQLGLDKFDQAAATIPKNRTFNDYPFLPNMVIFNDKT